MTNDPVTMRKKPPIVKLSGRFARRISHGRRTAAPDWTGAQAVLNPRGVEEEVTSSILMAARSVEVR